MQYLCLLCGERMLEHRAPDEAAALIEAYRELLQSLRASGHLLACNRLQPPDTAVTVRVRQGSACVTDGPFVETKEQLGGYLLLEARDLNEAIEIAQRIPSARDGCVEVRPVAREEATLRALGE